MACSVVTAGVAADNSSPDAQKTQQSAIQSSPEYQAAEDQFRKYQEAYDRGNAKALASFYAEDVDYIDEAGVEVKGRGEIEKLFRENFQANPGAKIAITIEELKPLASEVQNRGIATVTSTSGLTESTRYVTVLVKKADRWQISQLTQTAAPAPSASSQLEALQWLIGNWENKDADQTVETKVQWAGDQNFLVRIFKLRGDKNETDGWEIVGWDPDRQQIRSWIFDSNGDFGQSSWSYDGGHWLIRASNVLPDGSRSTTENLLTKVDDNTFTWESQNRTLDDDSQPSVPQIAVHRSTSNPQPGFSY